MGWKVKDNNEANTITLAFNLAGAERKLPPHNDSGEIEGREYYIGTLSIYSTDCQGQSPNPEGGAISCASIAMIVMVYLYIIGYNMSWGPIPWAYISKIFLTRLRAYDVGCASATQWLFNFVVTYITPSAISNISWRAFIMFGVFCFTMAVWDFLVVREARGCSLEEMDVVFERDFAFGRVRDIENVNMMKSDSFDGGDPSDPREGHAVEVENRVIRS